MPTIEQRKRTFAECFLRNPNGLHQAAIEAWPDDPRQGLQLASEWANDPEIKAICGELLDKGAPSNLPTKELIVQELIVIGRTETEEAKDRIAAYKLAADLLGYIQPAQTNILSKTHVDNRVMVIPNHGSLDDWEKMAKEQQRRLTTSHVEDDDEIIDVDNTSTKH